MCITYDLATSFLDIHPRDILPCVKKETSSKIFSETLLVTYSKNRTKQKVGKIKYLSSEERIKWYVTYYTVIKRDKIELRILLQI